MWTIRRAGPGDRDALAELCLTSVGPDDYALAFLDRFIREGVTFIAFDWPYVIGMMVYDDTPDGAAWLHAARTHPEYRRKGVATELMARCEALAAERGRDVLRLWAAAANAASVAANRLYGFRERARFTRMRIPATGTAPPPDLRPMDPSQDARLLDGSPILEKAAGYLFHDFYFLPLSRANAARLAREGALWRFGGNGLAISEDFEDAWGKDLQVAPLFGSVKEILRAAPAIAKARGADRVETFLPHDAVLLETAQVAGYAFMDWGHEAILFEKSVPAGRTKDRRIS